MKTARIGTVGVALVVSLVSFSACAPTVETETAAAFIATVPVTPATPITLHWEVLTPMPTARYKALAVAAGGKIYVIGGENGGGTVLTTVEEYDIATDTWTNCAPSPGCTAKPTAVWQTAGGEQDGFVYVVGGFTDAGGSTSLNTVEVYDPASNTWLAAGTACNGNPCDAVLLATQQAQVATANFGGQIFLVGGGNLGLSPSVVRFDGAQAPTAMFADCGAPCQLPSSRSRAGSAAVGTNVYALGGWDGGGSTNTLYEIDSVALSRTDCGGTCPPSAVFGMDAIMGSNNGILYAVALNNNTAENNVQSFDTSTFTWTSCGGTCPTLPNPIGGAGFAQVGNRLYLFGGDGGGFATNYTQVLVMP